MLAGGREETLSCLAALGEGTLAPGPETEPAERWPWTHFRVLIGLGSKLPSASTESCFSSVAEILLSK